MNRSEVFKTVRAHLLKQDKRCATSEDNPFGGCRYKHNGLKCAIGALIPDEMYEPAMEGRGVDDLVNQYPAFAVHLDGVADVDVEFLGELQSIHDEIDPSLWAEALETFRRGYGL